MNAAPSQTDPADPADQSRPSGWSGDAARWRAVASRDSRADGAFFYGVRTTRIFCRPSCASRMPLRENVEYFDTADDARAAGYRECKRCRPGGLPRELDVVQRACAALDADPQQRLTLAQLGDAVHMSPFHLQRLFKRVLGVSPRQYQAAKRGAALRGALEQGAAVTRASVDAGFGSSSRLYHSAPGELGMAPSAYRRKGAGRAIRYAYAPTPLGVALVAATDKGICRIAFGDDTATLIASLRADFVNAARIDEDMPTIAPFLAQIDAYLRGGRERFDLPLDVAATAFQQRVWDALQRIPYGETRSYTQIAETLGVPRAVRAVASACASNPVALAIPCHRVVQKGGSLAGYRWGLARKAALLDTEAHGFAGAQSDNTDDGADAKDTLNPARDDDRRTRPSRTRAKTADRHGDKQSDRETDTARSQEPAV
ncbi:bifunctional DNA-binding transcriptional regulator/O6-methylguanine-DNA methyltransferase Ada [Paraburkholderia caballeronis]|uniref:methylated-DNA--[protein]-cysteine S-methyltransferase n=1 Tax=Paraburkholderia caballeronis TaxID=416943 RepID=A0A1H7H6G8_9BURK|nr:bifunctional DNA-binding transcriptional regulator/O6-methylguanine-DNA methyltransferase Ada [Paraburkholderia caballeronis]PXW29660.1 AraC family transcriptional regulator of adaptative response/methylated-DNA-[protein]-cysteine methyltransferase [Paraburkholderia caballeronis]PXX04919.1 AraC family transcriptional regulator of adaptative response/methylated-DNA-[protein]-cysteine methyltransferase [Paraburkholderia caballeronis]RAK05980.1 AraC family transcriptional regulator of adaptative